MLSESLITSLGWRIQFTQQDSTLTNSSKIMLSVRHYFRSQHCMFCPSTTHENHGCVRILSLGIVCGWWWPSVREVSSDPPACLTLSCKSGSAGIGVSRFAGCRLVPYSLLPPGSPASLSTPCDIHMCMNCSV